MVRVEDCQGTHTHESTAAPDWQLWWHTTKLAVLVAHESPSLSLSADSLHAKGKANPEEPTHVHNIQTNQQHRQTTKEEEDGKKKGKSQKSI
jgi:hypothetical protein